MLSDASLDVDEHAHQLHVLPRESSGRGSELGGRATRRRWARRARARRAARGHGERLSRVPTVRGTTMSPLAGKAPHDLPRAFAAKM